MIDERRAHGLQVMYHAGAAGALQALNEACTLIAHRIVRAHVHRMRLPIQHERIQEIAHDASTRLIGRYLSDPDFRVRRFSKMLGYRVREELFISPRQRQKVFEAHVLTMDIPDAPSAVSETPAAGDPVLELAESNVWGKKAVADLCRSRSYRQAVKRIAAYVERRWIYDHAEALHAVYRALHAPQGANGRVSRSGLVGVRAALLRGRKPEREQPCE
jgi:hypothetical protein